MKELEIEIEKAKKLVSEAGQKVVKHYTNNTYGYYQSRLEYLRGLEKAKELIGKEGE